jgi:hypothetical protein
MKISYYKNTLGEDMVLLLDEANNQSFSMLKSIYDEQQAEAKASKVVDEATPV